MFVFIVCFIGITFLQIFSKFFCLDTFFLFFLSLGFLSLEIIFHHIRKGLPRFFSGLFTFSKALRAGVSPGSLIRCPNQLRRLFFIVELDGCVYF